jgi:hypothetical protein
MYVILYIHTDENLKERGPSSLSWTYCFISEMKIDALVTLSRIHFTSVVASRLCYGRNNYHVKPTPVGGQTG